MKPTGFLPMPGTPFNMFKRLITNKQGFVERAEKKAICPVMHECGMCTNLDLTYKNQISEKTMRLKEWIQKAGAPFASVPVKDCVESDDHLGWCSSVVLDIAASKDERGRRWTDIGYDHRGQVVDIKRCPIQFGPLNDIVAWIRTGIRVHDISVYSPRNRSGLLSQVIIKSSHLTKQSLVTFVVTKRDLPTLRLLARDIAEKQMSVVGVCYQIKIPGKKPEDPVLLVGKDEIEEKYGNFIFKISSNMHIPANPKMSWRIWSEIEKLCDLSGQENVLYLKKDDEFSALNQCLSRGAKDLILDLFSAKEKGSIDVAVVQQGVKSYSQDDLKSIVSLAPQKMVYFSKEQEIDLADLKYFVQHGYELIFSQPYDSRPGSEWFDAIFYLVHRP